MNNLSALAVAPAFGLLVSTLFHGRRCGQKLRWDLLRATVHDLRTSERNLLHFCHSPADQFRFMGAINIHSRPSSTCAPRADADEIALFVWTWLIHRLPADRG